MSKDLILLTGATGFVGFRTLIAALEAGYRVRAVVRKFEHVNKIKSHKATQPHLTDIEFAVVPDLSAKDAFASIFDSVKYVLHIASPLAQSLGPDSDIDAELIRPAVKGHPQRLGTGREDIFCQACRYYLFHCCCGTLRVHDF